MNEVTPKSGGQWGISKIVKDMTRDCWRASASVNKLADKIEMYDPPLDNKGNHVIDYALVRVEENIKIPDKDTLLLPGYLLKDKLDNVSFLTTLQTKLTGYSGIAPFNKNLFTVNSLYEDLLKNVFTYFNHSSFREKLSPPELHNTEFSDNFDDDPYTTRWTNRANSLVWDSTNFELAD